MRIRISEARLKSMIREAVKHYINENTSDENLVDRWYNIKETIGADKFLYEIFDKLSEQELMTLVDSIEKDYDIMPNDDAEEK